MRNTSWTTQSKEGKSIATTRITSLHTGIGRSTGKAISDIIDYVENPEKTDNGRLISCYQCDSRVADAEFLFSKRQYQDKTGRRRGKSYNRWLGSKLPCHRDQLRMAIDKAIAQKPASLEELLKLLQETGSV